MAKAPLTLNMLSFIGEISPEQKEKIAVFAKKNRQSFDQTMEGAYLMVGGQILRPTAIEEYEFELQIGVSKERARSELKQSYAKKKEALG